MREVDLVAVIYDVVGRATSVVLTARRAGGHCLRRADSTTHKLENEWNDVQRPSTALGRQ